MIGTGFDDGRYTGNHFLEMFYRGDDVANGRMSGRASAPTETDGCAVGFFKRTLYANSVRSTWVIAAMDRWDGAPKSFHGSAAIQ